MSVRRALVDCAVLSLTDACVFYPSCKGCFSRIDVQQEDTTRCRCSKCGYSCLREQVEYRYRLSLRVVRDTCIFGITVFGSCLDQFFGIHASGLQRLVQSLDGGSTRSTLLDTAVQDCFIGRHFIFGIKGSGSGPWLGETAANGSSSKAHFIASQMILPNAAGLTGCTVVSYYRTLHQRVAEYKRGSSDPSRASGPPPPTLLLLPEHLPSSFNNTTLYVSGLLSQSSQNSQHQEGTLIPTHPWRQSLGLVTSSAEQEESCNTQEGREENSRQTDNKTPQRGSWGYRRVTEERAPSPLLPLDCSSSKSPSFVKSPSSSIEKAAGNTPVKDTWFSPPTPGLNSSKTKEISAGDLTKSFLSSSLAWEDLPFSESLTEFLSEENKDCDIVSETEPHLNVQNQKETAKNNLEVSSPTEKVPHTSPSVCQRNKQITESNSRTLLDITKTPALNEGDLSNQVYKNISGCANEIQIRNICSPECYQEDDKGSFLSFNEEQLEVDFYNCSADLFSSSSLINNTNQINTHAETDWMTTEACPLLSKPNKLHLMSDKDTNSSLDKDTLETRKCNNRDSLIPGSQDFDFIPPSQSTPIVKSAVVNGSFCKFSPDAFHQNQPELGSIKTPSTPSSLCKSYRSKQLSQWGRKSTKGNVVLSSTSSRQSSRFTPKRRFWKAEKQKKLPAQQHRGFQSNNRSSDCDLTDNEVIVPPTPAAETQLSVKLRRRLQTEISSGGLGYSCKRKQGNKMNCKRTLLDQNLTVSQRSFAPTGNCETDEGSLDRSNCDSPDENEACDWSRDLFSDSV
ncbi:hypothetical protein PBY51_011484 [Eleginops maclovinus]|uniref:Replication factor A C-terminal domain-containing protein n=1 Tax=Eleginops maclovinus TaxID=56733 RepID=A0AAN7XUB0_ELEMC|nr:hypothetical protein PBY51_011484 [Eleginops maclovinus]